ncbi:MAG: ChaN family lipoprotein, partial [Mucilaginibacter sp.]
MKALLFFVLLIPCCLLGQDMAQHYKIYNTHTQKTATLDDIITDMGNKNVLFFGEEHNDSTGHYLEYVL